MRLLVDIGNTRVKGAVEVDGTRRALPALATGDAATPDGWTAAWRDALAGLPAPDRVVASNVAGAAVAGAFAQWTWERWQREAVFAQPRRRCAGMRTRYDEPARLGVDRWLAALAAWSAIRAPVCVVDAGTAVTVDIVDGDGEHLGGLIAPGLDLMRRSLTEGTAGLHADAVVDVAGFATNTVEAISLGCREAVRGLMTAVAGRLEATFPGVAHTWFVTGGGGAEVHPHAPPGSALTPDLVLDGLAVYDEADT